VDLPLPLPPATPIINGWKEIVFMPNDTGTAAELTGSGCSNAAFGGPPGSGIDCQLPLAPKEKRQQISILRRDRLQTFLLSKVRLLPFFLTRGRHLSWVVFLAGAALLWIAAPDV